MWEAIQGLVGFEETECIVFVAEKKWSVSESFALSRVSLWHDKGNSTVCDNVPQLNKVVRKSPPIYFDLSGFSSAHAELRYCRVDGAMACKSD